MGDRRVVQSGKLVHDYVRDVAAMTKRIFVRESDARSRKAKDRFDNSIETDGCYRRLRSREDKTVLRYCKCCEQVDCPVNLLFSRFLVRTCKFCRDFNGIKGTRLALIDFATTKEVSIYNRVRDNL